MTVGYKNFYKNCLHTDVKHSHMKVLQ